MNAIEIKNLHFSYGKENVLDGVSLCLKEGRLAILAGENGAGKSTLLRLLLGELPIGESHKGDHEEGSSDGSIEILGQDIRQFKDWSSISYVPQNGMGGWKDFPASVEEIVRANLYKQIGLFRFAGKKERQQVRAALAQVGMEEYQNRLIGRLSGGQQQRVLLARALVNEPKLLILDEPTSALDEKNASHFYRLLKKINAEKRITVLMVTHDRKRASSYADDIWVLEDGRVKQEAGKGDGQA
jgi:zinc transport system ATP-binding protein